MKVKLFTFLVFSLLAFLPMKAFVSSDVHRVEEKKDIDLEGDMEDERNKSLKCNEFFASLTTSCNFINSFEIQT